MALRVRLLGSTPRHGHARSVNSPRRARSAQYAAIPPRSFGTLVPRPGAVVCARFQTLSVVQAGDTTSRRQMSALSCANLAARVATPARESGAAAGTTGTPGSTDGRGSEPGQLRGCLSKKNSHQSKTDTDPWRRKSPARRRARSRHGARAAAVKMKKLYKWAEPYARRRGPRRQPRAPASF